MRKWILIIVPLFVWSQSTMAQDMVGCTQLLEDAREAYAAGMVELVPELLLPCIETGLSGVPRQEAYKLVVNAYLFDYLPEQADSLMTDFLDEYPEYLSNPADPAEFTLLLQTHQQRRADQLAAIAEQERIRQLEELAEKERARAEQEKQKEPRSVRGEISASFGFFLGISGSFPQIVERYSTGNPAQDEGSFGMGGAGFQLGGSMNLPLGRSVEVGVEVMYNRTRFNYIASPFSFTSYEYDEFEDRIWLPASMAFILNPESRTSVFLRFGLVADYLLSASASATRTYVESGTTYLRDVVVEKTKITDSRARMNLHGLAGLGIRIPLENAFIFLETRFTSSLFQVNRGENRYDNEDFIWQIYHVDSDFRIHQLSLSAGIAWNL